MFDIKKGVTMNEINKVWIKGLNKDGSIGDIVLHYPILKKVTETTFYVQSPALKVVGFSKISLEDAKAELVKDIDIFFKAHLHRKTLRTALLALGWRKEGDLFYFDIEPYLLDRAEFNEQMLQCA